MKKNFYIKMTRNEQGYSMLTVIFTIVLLSVLGLGLFTITTNTLKTSVNERNSQAVYYIAEAGVIETKPKLINEINNAYDIAIREFEASLIANKNNPSGVIFADIFRKNLNEIVTLNYPAKTDYEKHFSDSPIAYIEIEKTNTASNYIYTIKSEGKIDNSSSTSRQVSQKISVNLNSASVESSVTGVDYSVYSRNDILFDYYDIKNNVKAKLASTTKTQVSVNGKHYPVPISVVLDTQSFDRLLTNSYNDYLTFPTDTFENANYYPSTSNLISNNSLIEEKDWDKFNNKTLNIDKNLKLQAFSISNGGLTFTIDVGNTNKILYVDELKVNGTLNIVGSGNLTIFVKNKLSFGNTFLNTNGSPDKVKIYYAGSEELKFENNIYLNAHLFIKQANITYSAGGGMKGGIYSSGLGTFTLGGGVVNEGFNLILPNYQVNITNGTIKGGILCDNLFVSGGGRIESLSGLGGGNSSVKIEQNIPFDIQSIIEN
ncbi:hypothetical protein M3649_02330 [Ureibacillus chungkukjangi]|uniref:hypothetical protein n=1 Tax=Ureibacillus chungkukjangi TaxID=1202712 RepID=UPI00203F160B|nr:hypothetical protein [Ureibacillus chungkukjangi]MCM3386966.1 hypothetical protein [Ureibacillus chungkukjangi]